MTNAIFNYNQEAAASAGASSYITESGAYTGKILTAVYVISGQKKTQGMEFSFESKEGQTANYLTVYYAKADNTPLQGGINMINAIMGCANVQSMSSASRTVGQVQENYAPEIEGKPIGLLLQKVLYSKNNGEDGFKFEIKLPCFASNGQTIQEKAEAKPASRVAKWAATITDKDDRTNKAQQQGGYQQPASQQSAPQHSEPSIEFDDDIPF